MTSRPANIKTIEIPTPGSIPPDKQQKGACHREQFVNKSSFGLTGIVLRHIIRKIVFIGKAVYYDDQRPYIYQDQRT